MAAIEDALDGLGLGKRNPLNEPTTGTKATAFGLLSGAERQSANLGKWPRELAPLKEKVRESLKSFLLGGWDTVFVKLSKTTNGPSLLRNGTRCGLWWFVRCPQHAVW